MQFANMKAVSTTAQTPSVRPASDREARFVDEYLVDLNAAAAARRAGFPPSSANAASRILSRPAVRALVKAKLAGRAQRVSVKAEAVIAELARVAFFDPGALVDGAGEPLPLNALDPAVRAGLGAIEIAEFADTGRPGLRRRIKARPGEKVRALIALTRHLGVAAAARGGESGEDPEDPEAADRARRLDKVENPDFAAMLEPQGCQTMALWFYMGLRRLLKQEAEARARGEPPPLESDARRKVEVVARYFRQYEAGS